MSDSEAIAKIREIIERWSNSSDEDAHVFAYLEIKTLIDSMPTHQLSDDV